MSVNDIKNAVAELSPTEIDRLLNWMEAFRAESREPSRLERRPAVQTDDLQNRMSNLSEELHNLNGSPPPKPTLAQALGLLRKNHAELTDDDIDKMLAERRLERFAR